MINEENFEFSRTGFMQFLRKMVLKNLGKDPNDNDLLVKTAA